MTRLRHGDPGPIGTESQMHEPRRPRICLCYTSMGPPRHSWEHSSTCPEYAPKLTSRRLKELAVWVGLGVAFTALAIAVLLTPVAPRQRDEILWERVNASTDRGCDAKGNLLYRHWRGGFAGTELIVVEGGCR